jgi:hypothetical protein
MKLKTLCTIILLSATSCLKGWNLYRNIYNWGRTYKSECAFHLCPDQNRNVLKNAYANWQGCIGRMNLPTLNFYVNELIFKKNLEKYFIRDCRLLRGSPVLNPLHNGQRYCNFSRDFNYRLNNRICLNVF